MISISRKFLLFIIPSALLAACTAPTAAPATPSPTPPASTSTFTALPPTSTPSPVPPSPTPTPEGLPFPVRAAYYNPAYPEGWTAAGDALPARFQPQAGLYALDDPEIASRHIQQMQYGGIQAGIVTWHAGGGAEDQRLEVLFSAARGTSFRWALAYQLAQGDAPAPPDIPALLDGLASDLASRVEYLKISARPVLFIDTGEPACENLAAWTGTSQGRFFLAAVANADLSACPSRPDAWIPVLQAGQRTASSPDAGLVRPGLWPADQRMGIFRLPGRWAEDVQAAFAPGLKFHLIDSFNNWGQGTAIEPAVEWASASGNGAYLDALKGGVPVPGPVFVLSGAGDISVCDWPFDDQVAELFNMIPGEIFTLGDNSNEEGTSEQFQRCLADSWGRHLDRIHPSPGNHDYVNPGAQAYYEYYGARAGDPEKGYYSYTAGNWLVLSLNGNCSAVGGCRAGSEQETWLRAELSAHTGLCTLAYWHQPRWSSGIHTGSDTYDAFWRALYDYGVELVMNGHDHHYERFTPQNPDGQADPQAGIRQFIAGTGGAGTRWINAPFPNSEVLQTGVNGVLALSLYPESYEWQFIPAGAESFTDWGREACH